MKVIHITTVPQSLIFLQNQLKYFQSKNIDVHLITSPGEKGEEFAEKEKITAHFIQMTRAITPFRDLLALLKLCMLFAREKPQIIHAHTPKAALLSMLAGFILRIPNRIYHIHGLYYMSASGSKRRLLKLLEKLTCLLATEIYVVSFSLQDFAIQEQLTTHQKSQVIHNGTINGIDAKNRYNPLHYKQKRKEIRQALHINDDAFVIGFVGRLVIDKGIQELVNAWKTLQNRLDIEIHLLCVGEEECDKTSLLLDQIRLEKRVHLIGFVDELAPYYAAMDVLALPSYREGFGSVLGEASAMQIPVIATNIPGCLDAVQHNKTGQLVEVQNVKELVQAIEYYLLHRNIRKKHGIAGRKRVEQLYQPEQVWHAMYEQYMRLR